MLFNKYPTFNRMRSFQLLGIFVIVNQINARVRDAFPGEMTTHKQDGDMESILMSSEKTLDEENNGEYFLQKLIFF